MVQWIRTHWFVLTVGTLASLPILVAVVQALAAGWMPALDDGTIALRSYDVPTERSPLLGQFSQISRVLAGDDTFFTPDTAVFSPGPLLYWLLAIPARIAPEALIITTAIVNIACVLATLILVRRELGEKFMFVTAIAVTVMSSSLPTPSLYEIWNPYAAIFPFTLLLFVLWFLANGNYKLLPLAVLLASFVIQCHLTYLLPLSGIFIVVIIGLTICHFQRRAGKRESFSGSLRRSSVIALLVALPCWSAPILDQVTTDPGNMTLIAKAAHTNHGTLGTEAGWNVLTKAAGVTPWWINQEYFSSTDITAATKIVSSGGTFANLTTVLLIVFLTLLLYRSIYKVNLFTATASLISLILCLAIVWNTAASPKGDFLEMVTTYTLLWTRPAGMFVWLIVIWQVMSIASLQAKLSSPCKRVITNRRIGLAASPIALIIIGSCGLAGAVSSNPHTDREYFPVLKKISSIFEDELATKNKVGVVYKADDFYLLSSILYLLNKDGIQVRSVATYLSKPSRPRLKGDYPYVSKKDKCILIFQNKDLPRSSPVEKLGSVKLTRAKKPMNIYLYAQPGCRHAKG